MAVIPMKKAGRGSVNRSPYSKKGLSSDARVIVALLKGPQPQSRDQLCKNAKVSRATFYAIRPVLQNSGIIKETDSGYALWSFNPLEAAVETAINRLIGKGYLIYAEDLSNEIGMPWSEIEPAVYAVVKKLGLNVRAVDGKIRIQGWETRKRN
jgi:hypothetical protein